MILKELKITTVLGEPTNCYIVFDEESKEAMVIDPAGQIEKIIEMLDILKANLKYIKLGKHHHQSCFRCRLVLERLAYSHL